MLKWFAPGQRRFSAFGEYGSGTPPEIPLVQLLNIDQNNLKPFTKDILDPGQSEDLRASLSELSRGIRAYFQFQDILDLSMDADGIPTINRHYTYYESLVYLRESVMSWLDKNTLAALTLLRPFLELSVFHVYWYLMCRGKSYAPYYAWLKSGEGKPGFKRALVDIFENLPANGWASEGRLKELKRTMQRMYEGLCTYNHTPRVDQSTASGGGGLGEVDLVTYLYYLESVNILLRQVVYLYVLTYPMSLFPVEKHEKWGFESGPIGLFFDTTNYAVLEAYIGPSDIGTLKESLEVREDTKSLRGWFGSLRSLTPEEIESEWQRFAQSIPGFTRQDAKSIGERVALVKAFHRSAGWALNYIVEPARDDFPDEMLRLIRERLKTWERKSEHLENR